MNFLFVYGTLRRGHRDNPLLSAATFSGAAETVEHYALCLMNAKPLVTKRPVSLITGEAYSVSDELLKTIDRVAGHPSTNKRELVSIRLENGQVVDAWLYFYIQPLRNATVIESGTYTG